MRLTFKSINLPTPKTNEELVGATFIDPDTGAVVEVREASYFTNPQGWGWVLDTSGGTFAVFAENN